MSIRPVDFRGMIQNTQEISNVKANEDNKPLVQQQSIQVTVTKEAQQQSSTVRDMDETRQNEYDYEEGDGGGQSGYGRDSQKKRKKKQDKKIEDGTVIKKERPSFDMKI